MDKRFLLFFASSIAVMMAFMGINILLGPQQPQKPNDLANQQQEQQPADDGKNDGADGDKDGADADGADADGNENKADDGAADGQAIEPKDPPPVQPDDPAPDEPPKVEPAGNPAATMGVAIQRWITFGSLDPKSPFPFLATFNTMGAALERLELNDPNYRDLEDRSGYFGHLALTNEPKAMGCRVNVVGAGTPAAKAGVQTGDVIVAFNGEPIADGDDLNGLMKATRPKQQIELTVERMVAGKAAKQALKVDLIHRPLEIVRPEPLKHRVQPIDTGRPHDPLSLLMTLGAHIEETKGSQTKRSFKTIAALRTANWKLSQPKVKQGAVVEFSIGPAEGLTSEVLKGIGISGELELVKRFRIVPTNGDDAKGVSNKKYDMVVEIALRNVGRQPINGLSYQLDGPNGLPTEGWWYSNKVQPGWGAAGARDIVYKTESLGYQLQTCYTVASNATSEDAPTRAANIILAPGAAKPDRSLAYVGVDTQYFAAALIPGTLDKPGGEFNELELVAVDKTDAAVELKEKRYKLANVSFRLTSQSIDLAPEAEYTQSFVLFMGPKDPELLTNYQLGEIVYYGWFGVVSKPLVDVLHFFYWITQNWSYGLAIILLTILVRGCMYPISRKAAKNAQMMQHLAPEMKALAEKYKNDMEKRGQAQRELFAKHNYNPFGGCLLMFLQLPIFLGLYRALSVDMALRGAPLFPGLRWCGNLAAPDMLFYWEGLWDFLTAPTGWLGPYFNVLPLITVALFLVQQKMFTPPATDEQTRMQQKMMSWMTLLIGLMFFKVPAGLCIYFITSSLWGVVERKLLPKPKLPDNLEKKTKSKASEKNTPNKSGTNGAARKLRRKKSKK